MNHYGRTLNRFDLCPFCNCKVFDKKYSKQVIRTLDGLSYNLEELDQSDNIKLVYCSGCNKTFSVDYLFGYWNGYKKAINLNT